MYINESKREIIVTKAEYTKAMKVGTPEFEELFRAKQILPNAKIVIKKPNNKNNYKNLTKTFMLNYVKTNASEYLETLEDLFDSIGETIFDEDKDEYKEVSFFYVRNEFLKKFPQFMTPSDREKFEKAKKENNSDDIETSEEAEEMAA
jgi:hypothetical protein